MVGCFLRLEGEQKCEEGGEDQSQLWSLWGDVLKLGCDSNPANIPCYTSHPCQGTRWTADLRSPSGPVPQSLTRDTPPAAAFPFPPPTHTSCGSHRPSILHLPAKLIVYSSSQCQRPPSPASPEANPVRKQVVICNLHLSFLSSSLNPYSLTLCCGLPLLSDSIPSRSQRSSSPISTTTFSQPPLLADIP